MAKRQAGVGFCLKQNSGKVWLKSAEIMETLRRDTFLRKAESKVWGDVKALPLCQDLLGPNHDLAVLVSQGKVFIPTTTATDFFPFKPQHPLSESQTTPAICCSPHKAGGTSPSTIRRESNALAASRNGHHTSAPKPTVKAQGCMPCPRLSLNPNVPEHQGMSVSLGGMCQAPLTWPRG